METYVLVLNFTAQNSPSTFLVTLTEIGGIYDVCCLSSSLNHDNCLKLLYSQNGHPIMNGNDPPGNSRTTHKQLDGVNSAGVPLMTVLITRGPVAWMWVAWVRVAWPKLVRPSISQCSLGEAHQLDLYLHWSFFTGASVAPMNPGPSWLAAMSNVCTCQQRLRVPQDNKLLMVSGHLSINTGQTSRSCDLCGSKHSELRSDVSLFGWTAMCRTTQR